MKLYNFTDFDMKIFKVTQPTVNLMGDHISFYVAAETIIQAAEEYNKAKSIELIGNVIFLTNHKTTQNNNLEKQDET